ncbi:MAG TPA: ABC-type transport auxiliary lipoprotein family protein [Acetobacteraceae bacterium]|nr:ABC-type transport auxiliary lipoprotein family protein [Acetobacteraceae bacterium]
MRRDFPLPRRFAVFGTAALAGCSVLPQPKYVQQTQWPLVVRRPESLPPRAKGHVLVVRDIRPAAGLEQRGLQWLLPDGSVHVDFYNQWAVPPAQALTDDLRQWLAASGLFAAVVAPDSGLTPDMTLEGQLTAFIADPRVLNAHAALAIVLLNQHPVPAKVLLQRTITADSRMATGTPSGVVDALRAALGTVLRGTEAAVAGFAGR